MQAQAQTTRPSGAISSGWPIALTWIAVMHVAIHVFWYVVPQFVDIDTIGLTQYIVISATFGIGLVALVAMYKGQRWGRRLMLVDTVLNIFLTLPEVFGLEGIMRVGSIAGMVIFVVTAILLFRPEVRSIGS
ncbi:MAG: hypothetical protein ABI577_19445 [bacterium]